MWWPNLTTTTTMMMMMLKTDATFFSVVVADCLFVEFFFWIFFLYFKEKFNNKYFVFFFLFIDITFLCNVFFGCCCCRCCCWTNDKILKIDKFHISHFIIIIIIIIIILIKDFCVRRSIKSMKRKLAHWYDDESERIGPFFFIYLFIDDDSGYETPVKEMFCFHFSLLFNLWPICEMTGQTDWSTDRMIYLHFCYDILDDYIIMIYEH